MAKRLNIISQQAEVWIGIFYIYTYLCVLACITYVGMV